MVSCKKVVMCKQLYQLTSNFQLRWLSPDFGISTKPVSIINRENSGWFNLGL